MTSSGTGEVLFLVKSSRVREYHQQNLAILAAPDGANFEISYNRRWIQPGLAVAVGDGACIVFADSPYRDFEPIRWAVVERVDESAEKITLGIRVGSFTLGTERLTEQWRADADADYDAGRKETDKTRPYFLFSEPNPGLRNPNGWDEASAAWRDVRSRLDRNGFFDGSRFARLSRVETVEGLPIEPGGTVQVGTRLFAHLDIAAAAKPEAIVIESTPSGWAQLDGEITINDDSARVPLQVLASGNGTLRLNLMPEPMRSCRPAITLNAISDVATSTASSPSSVDAASVHRLVTALERTSALADDAWIDILQQHLIPMGGEDDRLLLNLAERCYNAGRLEETIASVAKMSQATPRSELLHLAASARLGSSTIDGSAFGRVPLEDHASLSLLISALAASPSAVVHELAPELWSNHLGLERVADLIDAVWGRIDDASIAAHAAELRGYSDMAAARRLITTRWPDPETIENAPLRTLIEDLGLTDETAPYLHRWIRVLASRHDWTSLADQAPRVRDLAPAVQPSLLSAIATDLLTSGDTDAEGVGFSLICEALDVAARSGQPDIALDLADSIRGACLGHEERSRTVATLLDQIERVFEDSDALSDWRAMQRDRSISTIGKTFVNRTLRLVGDIERPWEDSLCSRLGLKRVVRHESEKSKSANTDWLNAIDPEDDIVLIVYGRIGHALSTPLITHCRITGVQHGYAELGERGVIAALATLAQRA